MSLRVESREETERFGMGAGCTARDRWNHERVGPEALRQAVPGHDVEVQVRVLVDGAERGVLACRRRT